MTVDDTMIPIDETAGFAMALPTEGDFYRTDLSADLSDELNIVEKGQ